MPSQLDERALARALLNAERFWAGLAPADRLDLLQASAEWLGTLLVRDDAGDAVFWDLPPSVMQLLATDALCREEAARRGFAPPADVEMAVAHAAELRPFRLSVASAWDAVGDWPALVRLSRQIACCCAVWQIVGHYAAHADMAGQSVLGWMLSA